MHQTYSVYFNAALVLGCRTSHLVNECESHLRDLHELGSSAPLKQLRMGLKQKTILPRSFSSANFVTDGLKMNCVCTKIASLIEIDASN